MQSERELQNNLLQNDLLQSNLNDRRSFIKLLAAAPLFASLGARSFASAVAATAKATGSNESFSNNIYTRLGVRPVINCVGTWTYLTASLELPEVRAACEAASHYFVDLFELQAAAGRRLAQLSGAESGMVTSGSAGAISAATAACIAGSDPKKIYQLPDTTGMKGEVVFLGERTPWDSCIRLTGAKLIVAPTVNDLPAALTSQTAMVYTTWGDDERLQSILKITKPAGVPVLLDQAGHIPPYSNFTRLANTGVDLFCISGGKGLRGPQVSGVLLGRKDLIDAALYNSNPWEGSICRPMKVGKEEIMGVLAAIDYWSKPEAAVIQGTWQRQMERIAKLVSTVPGVQAAIGTPPSEKGNSYPTLTITWDEKKFGLTANQCGKQLREGNPRIDVWTGFNFSGVLAREQADKIYDPDASGPNQLQIFSVTMQPGQDLIVGNRIRQVLEKARKQAQA
jgi:seryl-tRNA(Sec) selenium transferase